jgi:hypothetical protein
MVLHGKEKALEQIPKSSIAFISKITHVQRGISSTTMPPRDHYTLQFDHKDIRTIRGRVYDTMIDFDYSQVKIFELKFLFFIVYIFSNSSEKVLSQQPMIYIVESAKLKYKFRLLVIFMWHVSMKIQEQLLI